MRTKFILLALNYPGLKLLLLRKTLPELRENHILPMLAQLHGIARYIKDERAFIFPNGSRIKMGYCDSENDIYQYTGQEYDVIGVEECTHFTWQQVQYLMTCNRNTRTDFKPRMYFTGNPGGVGHNWFKRLFVKGQYESAEDPNDYDFVPATVDDNHVLMANNPEYIKVLDALPEVMRQAHRYGNWDIFEGQFFEEFRDDPAHYGDGIGTHVIEPFEVPADWILYRSFDFGYSRPFSVGWWAVDYDGRLYRILELYGCTNTPNEGVKWTPDKIFSEIARIEHEQRWLKGKQIIGVADPSIWDASRGEAIIEMADRAGVHFGKADNTRLPGWMQVHYRLQFDDQGIPDMYVFNTCKAFIRTVPELQYSETRPEDLDTDGEDHCLSGDTQVLTDGGYKPINSLVGTEGFALSHDGKYHRYFDARLTRRQADIYKVELDDGTTIYCTDDHRFMLPNGDWASLNNLAAGAEVKIYDNAENKQHGTDV